MHEKDFKGWHTFLCTLQAETFEKSVEKMDTSSEIFIRRFMKSEIAKKI